MCSRVVLLGSDGHVAVVALELDTADMCVHKSSTVYAQGSCYHSRRSQLSKRTGASHLYSIEQSTLYQYQRLNRRSSQLAAACSCCQCHAPMAGGHIYSKRWTLLQCVNTLSWTTALLLILLLLLLLPAVLCGVTNLASQDAIL